jgi:hypothetical protein
MTIEDIRSEILKEINQLPESILPEVLSVLRRLKVDSSDEIRRQRSFQQVLAEDGELLRRLAQNDTEL